MPRKTKGTLTFAPFKEVVQVALWEDFERDVETYLASETDIQDEFLDLSSHGYTVTVEPSTSGGFVAKVRDLDRSRESAGLMFFSEAETRIEAMAIAVVKEHFLGRGSDWTSKASSTLGRKWR